MVRKPAHNERDKLMKVKYLIIISTIGFCLSQDFNQMRSNPIQGFTVSPENNKMRINFNFANVGGDELFDWNGDIWKDGDLIVETNSAGDTLSIDTLKFVFQQNTLNINFDYLGSHNVGLYLNTPINFNREINNIPLGESGLGDLSFGIYFLWDQYFKTQRIKTGAFYKRAKSGLPGDLAIHYTGTGQNNFGFDMAIDLLLSEKINLSLKQITTFNGQSTYLIPSTEDSISLEPSTTFDLKARVLYNYSPNLSFGVDYIYQSFASILEDYSQSTSFISMVKPTVGFKLLSDFSLGYLNIESLNFVGSWSFALNGETYYKPNIFQFGTQFYFN